MFWITILSIVGLAITALWYREDASWYRGLYSRLLAQHGELADELETKREDARVAEERVKDLSDALDHQVREVAFQKGKVCETAAEYQRIVAKLQRDDRAKAEEVSNLEAIISELIRERGKAEAQLAGLQESTAEAIRLLSGNVPAPEANDPDAGLTLKEMLTRDLDKIGFFQWPKSMISSLPYASEYLTIFPR